MSFDWRIAEEEYRIQKSGVRIAALAALVLFCLTAPAQNKAQNKQTPPSNMKKIARLLPQ
jgi:invasion protein IalB